MQSRGGVDERLEPIRVGRGVLATQHPEFMVQTEELGQLGGHDHVAQLRVSVGSEPELVGQSRLNNPGQNQPGIFATGEVH